MFEDSLNSYKKLRWLGCASLSLAYVACGKVDAYEEKGIKIWDVAAGIALVRAAGGRAEFSFNSDGSLNLVADNHME
jgi:myo-inositol-1(or 4)-monophosphatase